MSAELRGTKCYVAWGAAERGPLFRLCSCLDGACTALTTVSGTVTVQESLDMDSPAAGATVSVHQTSLSTTADEFGEFSFDAFPGALVL
jgi:hypothetical protein